MTRTGLTTKDKIGKAANDFLKANRLERRKAFTEACNGGNLMAVLDGSVEPFITMSETGQAYNEYKAEAIILSAIFGVHVSHLFGPFPEDALDRAEKEDEPDIISEHSLPEQEWNDAVERDIALRDDNPSPYDFALDADRKRIVGKHLMTLTPSEESVIRARYGLGCKKQSREDITLATGMGADWVRSREVLGLRKLQHPRIARRLKSVFELSYTRDGFDGWLEAKNYDKKTAEEISQYRAYMWKLYLNR